MRVLLALWLLLFAPLRALAAEWAVAPSREAPALWVAEDNLPASFERMPGVVADVWSTAADRGTAQRLANHAAEAAPRLAEQLGVGTGPVIQIVLAPTEQQFRSLQPGRTPIWADGTAWPRQGVLFLRSPRIRAGTATPLTTVLEHEIVHVLLGQAFGAREVPYWLQEGVAKVLAREFTPDMTRALATGALGDDLMSLERLTGRWPQGELDARLAYAQSADFIAWLRETHGREALPALVREMAMGRSVDAAMRAATGQPMAAVEAAWLSRLQSRPLPLQLLADGGVFMLIALGVFVVGGALRLRRNRARLERWARDEELHDRAVELLGQRWVATREMVH